MALTRPLVALLAAAASLCLPVDLSAQTFSFRQQLTGTNGSDFGRSVDIDGDAAVVGARALGLDIDHVNQGAAYVYVRSGTTWTPQQRLLANDAASPTSLDSRSRSAAIGLSSARK